MFLTHYSYVKLAMENKLYEFCQVLIIIIVVTVEFLKYTDVNIALHIVNLATRWR
jgi:hypothetical protein